MIACSVVDLPGAVRADQADDLALVDLQANVAHGGDGAVAHLEAARARAPAQPSPVRHDGGLAEVGGGDVEVAADLVGRALGERPALVEHLDPVADVHDERHVVVDQQHAGLVVVADRAHDRGELGHLRLGQPGRRLVHEHERRLGGERAGDAEPPLVAVRQRARRRLGQRRQAEQLEQLVARRRRASRGPAPTPSAATSTFSRTESSRNERLCWNVRASPARARRCALQPVTRALPSSTLPAVGKSKPVSTLTSVDLPAPFGPIRPTTSCRCSSSVTSCSARTPSKDRETEEARSVSPGLLTSFRDRLRGAHRA